MYGNGKQMTLILVISNGSAIGSCGWNLVLWQMKVVKRLTERG